MRALVFLLSAVLLSFYVSVLNATTIHVPADSATIQAGINGAVDGDTVLVADGTYTGDGNRNIDFLGKAMVVMSENGPESCIIDCEGSEVEPHRGFYFHNGEEASSVLKGFTITNGYADYYGGGIYCHESSPTIVGNMIMGNTAGWGGGIRCQDSYPTIEGNTITGNQADYSGGGINCWLGGPTISNNIISGNSSNIWGGGIILIETGSHIISNNLISANVADTSGGIECYLNANPTITNNTITVNTATTYSGGLTVWEDCNVTVSNTIFWGNTAPSGEEIVVNKYTIPATLTISYSDVEGGEEAVFVCEGCTLNWGDGMIDEDPMFVQPDTSLYTDHRLLWGSPCIDTGDPNLSDADGTRSDMGTHYFNQLDYLTLYITPDITEVAPGGQLGVTYTAINRWGWSQPFWALSIATLSGSTPDIIMGPNRYILPANYTAQVHTTYDIPSDATMGVYNYWSGVGLPPGIVFDEDSFTFTVTE
ncbi:MAG: DUF1565 domain-containing protein [Candidatus Glassbacteria bacterium]